METLETNPITLRSIVAAPAFADKNTQQTSHVTGLSKVSKLSDSGYNSVSKPSGASFRNNSENTNTRNTFFRSFENEQPDFESQINPDQVQKVKEDQPKSNSAPWRYNKANSYQNDQIQKSSQEPSFNPPAQIRQRPNMTFGNQTGASSNPPKNSTFSGATGRSGQKQSIDDLIKKFHVLLILINSYLNIYLAKIDVISATESGGLDASDSAKDQEKALCQEQGLCI